MKKQRTLTWVTPVCVAVLIALVLGNPRSSRLPQTALAAGMDDDDNHSCSLATLHGSYGSGTAGWINSSSDPNAITIGTFVPYAEVASFKFDGQGSFTATAQPDFGGQILPPNPATGTYTVDSSTCSGTMTINIPGGGTINRSLVIVEGGRDIEFVSTDPGLVTAGSLKKR
jgi:hypothetical protein